MPVRTPDGSSIGELRPGALMRRCLLQGAAVSLSSGAAWAEDEDPGTMMRPQIGDVLVHSQGDQAGSVIQVPDLKIGAPQILAWAMDPTQNVVRDGSRLNQVLLLRLDPAELGPQTQKRAAEGLVAYSAICTHAQCPVTGWIAEKQLLHCPCHQSEYDPRNAAIVVAGPAPRALAALPLKVVGGKLLVAGLFTGRVGMDRQSM